MGEDDRSRWLGPPGWLEPLPAGALLAVRVRPDGEVVLTVLDAEPTASDTLVASVRAAYEAEVENRGCRSSPRTCCSRCWRGSTVAAAGGFGDVAAAGQPECSDGEVTC